MNDQINASGSGETHEKTNAQKASDGTGASKVRFETITENNESQRIDNFLLLILKGVPKSKIYRIIRKGEVRVNKGRIKPEYKLKIVHYRADRAGSLG